MTKPDDNQKRDDILKRLWDMPPKTHDKETPRKKRAKKKTAK